MSAQRAPRTTAQLCMSTYSPYSPPLRPFSPIPSRPPRPRRQSCIGTSQAPHPYSLALTPTGNICSSTSISDPHFLIDTTSGPLTVLLVHRTSHCGCVESRRIDHAGHDVVDRRGAEETHVHLELVLRWVSWSAAQPTRNAQRLVRSTSRKGLDAGHGCCIAQPISGL